VAVQQLAATGDDYELLFAASPARREAVLAAGRAARVPLSRIGQVVAGEGLFVRDRDGASVRPEGRTGFTHD